MKTIKQYVVLSLLFVSFTIQAQTNIIKEGNYTVSGKETLTASEGVILKPNSWIKPGSDFFAKITPDVYNTISLTENENYVFTRVFQEEMSSVGEITKNSDVIESVTYLDGLGRPKQQITIKGSPNAKDIVTHIPYDDYGRKALNFLPFERESATLGNYTTIDVNAQINSYYQNKYADDYADVAESAVNAYSQNIFEPSPLNRIKKQAAPGKNWKATGEWDSEGDNTIKFDWTTNTANEVVYFKVDFPNNENTEDPRLVKDEYYDPKELKVSIVKDENWKFWQTKLDDHTTKEYTDKQGRVVLKRTYNNGTPHDTYYVYDDFGNLTYVIPPKVTVDNGVSASELAELCYQYKYDYRNRLVEKKIPGKDWEYIVYNTLDQPVMTQDGLQRSKSHKEWLFTKYDAFGRVIYTGIIKNNSSRLDLQDSANNNTVYSSYEAKENTTRTLGGTEIYYTNNAIPRYIDQILTVNYYDDYEVGDIVTFNPADGAGPWEEMLAVPNVKGLPTVSQVKVLNTDKWVTTATYYDDKGRAWETHVKNEYLNTEDWVLNKLDFAGKILKTRSMHTKGSNAPIITVDDFTYDHMGRLVDQKQQINNQPQEHIIENVYDEIGQLTTKNVGGGLQEVNYAYNVRGWLKGINDVDAIGDDLFSFKINYDTVEGRFNEPSLYNGNISQTIWKTANDNIKRAYTYSYDALNRITKGMRSTGNNLMTEDSYSVWGIAYDKNGNIGRISRNGRPTGTSSQLIDELYYEYSNNKLLKVRDASTSIYKAAGFKDGTNTNNDYVYDVNGNMTEDRNKGISDITYNHLNLPVTVRFNDDSSISYIYDAVGMKQRKVFVNETSGEEGQTDYAGNYIYENDKLKFFNHVEGYVEPLYSIPKPFSNEIPKLIGANYVYQYKDHLGNIRLSYTDMNKDGQVTKAEIQEEKNYYPFGMEHKGYNDRVLRDHPYGFNGIELTENLGLNLYEMPLRQYDPTIARWTSIDPVTHHSMSTYNAFDNNPTFWADPSGADGQLIYDLNGNPHYVSDSQMTTVYQANEGSNDKGSGGNFYEKLDDNGNGTGQYKYFGVSGKVKGYEKLGPSAHINETDSDGNTTRIYLDGKTLSSYKYNHATGKYDILLEDFDNGIDSRIEGTFLKPINNGTIVLGALSGSIINGIQHGTIAVYESLANDVDATDVRYIESFGYTPIIDRWIPYYTNGEFISIDIYSQGEKELAKIYSSSLLSFAKFKTNLSKNKDLDKQATKQFKKWVKSLIDKW